MWLASLACHLVLDARRRKRFNIIVSAADVDKTLDKIGIDVEQEVLAHEMATADQPVSTGGGRSRRLAGMPWTPTMVCSLARSMLAMLVFYRPREDSCY